MKMLRNHSQFLKVFLGVLFALIVGTSCENLKSRDHHDDVNAANHDNHSNTPEEKTKIESESFLVSSLYAAKAIPFDASAGGMITFNFEKLYGADAEDEVENQLIQSACMKSINNLGFRAVVNDRKCKGCTEVKMLLEVENKGFSDSTLIDCKSKNKTCTMFKKNFRKKIAFILLDQNKNKRKEIRVETLSPSEKISDVTSGMCRAAFKRFPEILSNTVIE